MAAPIKGLYGGAQVAELDRRVIEDEGVPGFELMQRAADAAFETLRARWPGVRGIAVVTGPGNNGADGFLVARLALTAGIGVRLFYLSRREQASGDAGRALAAFEQAGGRIEAFDPGSRIDAEVVVDALLGTGLARPVAGRFLAAVRAINRARERGAGVLAVDIPSGLDADRGSVWGEAVRADATATFIGAKLGLFTGLGPAHAGAVSFHDLDAPATVYADLAPLARRVDNGQLGAALPARPRDAHKGDHGHLLCVGGNIGMGGAVRLAAEAALRIGAGLVSVATRAENAAALTQARPELMCRGVAGPEEVAPLLGRASVVAIGPGLGQDPWAKRLFAAILESAAPLVVDADALNLLAAEPVARGNWVLTPHPGEAARLLASDTGSVQRDRPAAIAALCERYAATVVLKGAGTLIQGPNEGLWLCDAGNPGMATGGMGDLLTGVIGGLLAQRLDPERAARVGACLHARAGDAAARDGERGLLAADCLIHLRRFANPG